MNARQRSKRRVQRQIRARMSRVALAVEFIKALPPAFHAAYWGATWQLPVHDTHWLRKTIHLPDGAQADFRGFGFGADQP